MEDDELSARRKLEFQGKPFRSKLFYVNVKIRTVRQRVEAYIVDLGGSIETFLTNDIYLFISDSRLPTKRPRRLNGNVAGEDDTACGNKQTVPLSRGKVLLLKARKNTNDSITSDVNAVTDIREKAVEMGIQIEHVHTFIKLCKSLGATSKTKLKKVDSFSDITPIKWNEKCFLKVEDVNCQYKPLYKRLENLPQLFPENGGGSPFDGRVVLNKPSTESTTKKDRKTSRFSHKNGGYCEMCQCLFQNSLKQHLKSTAHQRYVRNKENFKKLGKIMKKLPSLNTFLFKYIPTKRPSRAPCYQSDSSPNTPETSQCHVNVFVFSDNNSESDVNCGNMSESVASDQVLGNRDRMDETCIQDETSLHTNQQTFVTSCSVSSKIEPCHNGSTCDTIVPTDISDNTCDAFDVQSNHSFDKVDLALSDNVFHACNNQLIDGTHGRPETFETLDAASTAKTLLTAKTPLNLGSGTFKNDVKADLQFNDYDALSGLFNEQGKSCMFSELSEPDSQTNTLKNLIHNLSLHNDLPSSRVTYTEPFDNEPETPDPNNVTSSSTDVTITTTTTSSDVDVETPMSQGTPFSGSVVGTPGSINQKLVLSSRKEKKSRNPKHYENDSMYCSHKTSDTKLKLCRVVVTPVNQKSNLKMFWKVRKTGDCRLVFSAEKRKRSESTEETSIQADADSFISHAKARVSSHKSKRQRLVF